MFRSEIKILKENYKHFVKLDKSQDTLTEKTLVEEIKKLSTFPPFSTIEPYTADISNEKFFERYKATLPLINYLFSYFNIKDSPYIESRIYALKLLILFGDVNSIIHFQSKLILMAKSLTQLYEYTRFLLPMNPLSWNRQVSHTLLRRKELLEDILHIPDMFPIMDTVQKKLLSDSKFGDTIKVRLKRMLLEVKKTDISKIIANFYYSKVVDPDAHVYDQLILYKHKYTPDTFSTWLKLKEKAQDSETILPAKTAFMDGSILPECKDFYFIKIHHKDPRNAILGDLTGCCQTLTSGANHVVEDLTSEKISILIIARKSGSQREEKNAYFLSPDCNEADIIGFVRIYQTVDESKLVLDVIALRPTFKREPVIKKISQLLARYSQHLIESLPQYAKGGIWFGSNRFTDSHILFEKYLSLFPSDEEMEPPLGMEDSESDTFTLMSDETKPLRTELIYAPERILSYDKSNFNSDHPDENIAVLSSLIGVGTLEHIKHFKELLESSEFESCRPIDLACIHTKSEVLDYFLQLDDPELLFNGQSPNPIISIALSNFPIELKLKYLNLIFSSEKPADKKLSLLTFSEDKTTALKKITDCASDDIILLYLTELSKHEKVLYTELSRLTWNPPEMRMSFINNPLILNLIFSTLTDTEIQTLFTPNENICSPIIYCNSQTFKFMVEHKKISDVTKKAMFSSQYKNMNILEICLRDKDKLTYLLQKCEYFDQKLLSKSYMNNRYGPLNIVQTIFLRDYKLDCVNLILNLPLFSDEVKKMMMLQPLKKDSLAENFILAALKSSGQPTKRIYLLEIVPSQLFFVNPEETRLIILTSLRILPSQTNFVLQRMSEEKEQFIAYFQKDGLNLINSIEDDIKRNEYIKILIEFIIKNGIYLPFSYFIPKEIFIKIIDNVILIPKLLEAKESTGIDSTLRTIKETAITLKKLIIGFPEKNNLLFNVTLGLYHAISTAKAQNQLDIKTIIESWKSRHASLLSTTYTSTMIFMGTDAAEIVKNMISDIEKNIFEPPKPKEIT